MGLATLLPVAALRWAEADANDVLVISWLRAGVFRMGRDDHGARRHPSFS
ncbi:hypothetical protein JDO7802_00252 [Jannaschia donghaensis]|uniref:Uncharacterized protein n=1 Tax=Jannaschia donghaensis TaxID=420998 RepID=A0A0M6YE42_9RHOB|nr:hypothetical protein JDO7802_00252 [Jannaschia donghaensis]